MYTQQQIVRAPRQANLEVIELISLFWYTENIPAKAVFRQTAAQGLSVNREDIHGPT
jgi:hypothetical protein